MIRPRRFRQTKAIRNLLQENHLMLSDLVLPVFVHDQVESISIDALDGHQRLDEISLLKYCEQALSMGISSIAIFPSIEEDKKSSDCLEALNDDNLMCHVTRRIKKAFGDDLIVIGDIFSSINSLFFIWAKFNSATFASTTGMYLSFNYKLLCIKLC